MLTSNSNVWSSEQEQILFTSHVFSVLSFISYLFLQFSETINSESTKALNPNSILKFEIREGKDMALESLCSLPVGCDPFERQMTISLGLPKTIRKYRYIFTL